MSNPLSMILLSALMLMLAACSPSPEKNAASKTQAGAPVSNIPTQAQVDKFIAEGPDPTLRRIAPFDYLMHYRVMEATGIVNALGGEERATAALKALGNEYERKLRGAQADVPKMIPVAFDGTGIDSGFVGMGMGAFGGLIAGTMVSGAVSEMSDEQLSKLAKEGPIQLGDKDRGAELKFDQTGAVDQVFEFTGKVSEGLTGKVKVKVHIDACPDPQGKLTVTMNVDSQMGVEGKPGVGGFVRSEYKLERFLDDDAHLISKDGDTASMTMSAGGNQGGSSQSFDVHMGYDRTGGAQEDFGNERGFSIFHMDEVRHAAQLAEESFIYQRLIAEIMLRGIGKGGSPWESGRCIDLKVISSPGQRKGIKPNTAFDVEAIPRTKADGAPAGGTVTATLSGGASLQPASGKVRADAKYGYAGPAKKDEEASIAFEARSKRGVGKATLEFDTKTGGYRIAGGKCAESYTVCDITKPFTGKACGATYTHTPTSDKGGTYSFRFEGGGGVASSSGTYALSGPEEKLTATHSSSRVCITAGMTRCSTYPAVTGTWTKIDSCE